MALRSSALRDALVLLAVFGVLLGGLYAYTGIWPPAVIVESGSMMHADSEVSYGRSWITLGPATIDPGDLVLVKKASEIDEIETYVEGGEERYGSPGDVIVYYPANNRERVPIIHRAMAYIEKEGTGDTASYRVRWNPDAACPASATKDGAWCEWGRDGITLEFGREFRLTAYTPKSSGFVTKGDNPATNPEPDQISGLSRDETGAPAPVKPAWIEGKARAELPWLGLIKLALAPRYNQEDCGTYPVTFHFFDESPASKCRGWYALGHAYAPKDLWVMLGASLFALVGIPLIYDAVKNWRARMEPTPAGAADSSAPPPPPHAHEPPASHAPPRAAHDDAPREPGDEPR